MVTSDPRSAVRTPLADVDAVLLLSFGGPERAEDVLPFLTSVTGGKGIPESRLREVGRHYYERGGRSPINDNNRALLAALRVELDGRGIDTPLLWSNRHAAPFTADVLAEADRRGWRRILVLLTSAYSGYASCRSYREHLAEVADRVATTEPFRFQVVRPYAVRPVFARRMGELAAAAMRPLAGLAADAVRVLFVTHSIPTDMAAASGTGPGHAYVTEHRRVAADTARAIAAAGGPVVEPELVFCSRSGRPGQPWLEPDVNEAIAALPPSTQAVVLIPIGFVSDHMEVVYDLDTQAAQTAADRGLRLVRTPTLGVDPAFVSDLVDALLERVSLQASAPIDCPATCCLGTPEPDKAPPNGR